jgi:hypothetical protein
VKTARYRAAWPELRRAPLELSRDIKLPSLIEPFVEKIIEGAGSLLKHHQVTYDDGAPYEGIDIDFANVQTAGDPKTCVPTLMVCASWTKDKQANWKNAVRDISALLYKISREANFDHSQIQIDIIAPNLTQKIYYGPVSDHDKRYDSWDSIRELVHQRLESFQGTKGHMTAIALFHYGRSNSIPDNPVTVYIAVDFKSDETQWLGIIDDIERNIHSRGWIGVQVHIEHNVGMQYSFPLLPPTGDKQTIMEEGREYNKRIRGDYQRLVNLGDDIGSATYITRSDNVVRNSENATLGFYVELKTKRTPTWKKYAITNYHAVRSAFDGFILEPGDTSSVLGTPRMNSDLRQVDEHGFHSNMNLQPFPLESPSRAKHNFTIWSIDQEIIQWTKDIENLETKRQGDDPGRVQTFIDGVKLNIQEAKNERQKKLDFFNDGKQKLGQVYAASGFFRRTTGNMRLDWALIDVDVSRQGSNGLPPENVWQRKYPSSIPLPYMALGSLLQDQSTVIGPSNLTHVWKVGTTTGPTTATYHRKKAACGLTDDSYLSDAMEKYKSTEYIFQSHAGVKFCARGDSGSAVWDQDGGIVGILFRGHSINKSFDAGYGYVTPIESVFEDIKKFSKGGITDIRIARS